MTESYPPTDEERVLSSEDEGPDPEAPADDLNREEPQPDEDRTVVGFEEPFEPAEDETP